MTLPRPNARAKRKEETEQKIKEEKPQENVQVISNEQLMHLKLDNIQMQLDAIIKELLPVEDQD